MALIRCICKGPCKGLCPVPGPRFSGEQETWEECYKRISDWLDNYLGEGPCTDNPAKDISKSALSHASTTITTGLTSLVVASTKERISANARRQVLSGFSDLYKIVLIAADGKLRINKGILMSDLNTFSSDISNEAKNYYLVKLFKAIDQAVEEVYHSTNAPVCADEKCKNLDLVDHHVSLAYELISHSVTVCQGYIEEGIAKSAKRKRLKKRGGGHVRKRSR